MKEWFKKHKKGLKVTGIVLLSLVGAIGLAIWVYIIACMISIGNLAKDLAGPIDTSKAYRQSYYVDADCPLVALTNKPAVSPSGKYVLYMCVGSNEEHDFNYFYVKINKRDADGKETTIFTDDDQYSTLHDVIFMWDDQKDIVWVNTTDEGHRCYMINGKGQWHRLSWEESGKIPLPKTFGEAMKKAYGGD